MPRRSNTREQLIEATRAAVRDVGVAGATAREVTSRASANLASIPYHFGSKDALVSEALIAEARELVDPVLALLADRRPGPERAAAAIAMLHDLFEARRSQVPVYLAALAAAPHTPAVRTALAGLWDDLRSRLAEDIADQVDSGRLPGWVSPEPMAAVILGLVNGVIVASAVDPDGPGHRDVAGQFLGLLLAAATDNGQRGPGAAG